MALNFIEDEHEYEYDDEVCTLKQLLEVHENISYKVSGVRELRSYILKPEH
ncbi:hypothetical protein D1BOALGB6SA_2706 [Olavius sp. associated proteobacterium Delta 1]|nr:hypothetical protein D1BOALGB6SA_2706 [Olavius sp. associated proteobacterium Delta 1]